MKGRFSAIDIRASVQDLKQKIIGLRLQNVYDINSKTFLLKFSQPDRKEYLVIESGIRLHLTQFSREKATNPSNFCVKLRKHLRTRRLTNVRQIGADRIVAFEFSAAGGLESPGTYHLICEFYASGNVILTDHEFKILTLLRVVKSIAPKSEAEVPQKDLVVSKKTQSKSNENDKAQNAFSMAAKEVYDFALLSREFEHSSLSKVALKIKESAASTPAKQTKKEKKERKDLLKAVINDACLFGLPLAEHCLLEFGIDPNCSARDPSIDLEEGSEFMTKLDQALKLADNTIINLDHESSKGFIIMAKDGKRNAESQEPSEANNTEFFDEYHPILFNQHKSLNYKEFPTFVTALDQFYSMIEGQKAIQKLKAQEEAAKAKLQGIKNEQMGRVDALAQAEIQNREIAAAIEANLELVDQIILVVRSLIASGMDWQELGDMVKEEARQGNHLAAHISSLNLKVNQITVSLPNPNAEPSATEALSDDDDDSDRTDSETEDQEEPSRQPQRSLQEYKASIDLNLSAHANASRYYTIKKASLAKKEKTLAVVETAFKNAEKKVQQDLADLKQNKPTQNVNKMRKVFWFEKFMWFISSEGYLIVAGRDLQQNELLVKKYLKAGDIYIHADMHGAATVIVKNPGRGPIPPSTLNQAGTMSVCQSRAWESKILTSAWWVFHHQVSKSAPTGEFLPTGSFMIRGKKNFLAPSALTYGFGVMYVLDSNSTARRLQLRLKEEKELEAENLTADIHNEAKQNGKGDLEDKDLPTENDDQKTVKISQGVVDSEPKIDESVVQDKKEIKVEVSEASLENKEPILDKYGLESSEHIQEQRVKVNESGDNENASNKESNSKEENEDASTLSVVDQLLRPYEQNDESKNVPRKRISAKDRRAKKKDTKGDETNTPGSGYLSDQEPIQKQAVAPVSKPVESPVLSAKPKADLTSAKRGQKAKLKKIQTKYADQDEEEKLLRMELLASDKGPQPKGKKAKKQAEQRKVREQQAEATKDRANQISKPTHTIKDEPQEGIIESVIQPGEDAQEIRALLEEENVVILEEEESESLLQHLDGLVGELLPEEEAEFMIAVSAPLPALNKLKFKIKLQPGTMKKGQSAKVALNHFQSQSDCSKADQQLMKQIPHQDAINVMLAKSKVVAPNLSAAKKQASAKAAKKKARQQEN